MPGVSFLPDGTACDAFVGQRKPGGIRPFLLPVDTGWRVLPGQIRCLPAEDLRYSV